MEVVTFELSQKLKVKGFNEPCYMYYHIHDNIEDSIASLECTGGESDFINSYNRYRCAAPTISQVLKWLREECGVFILIEPDILHPEYRLTFTIRIKFYIKGEEDEGFSYKYLSYRKNSYEEATLAGIEYVLDNLI